MRSFIIQHLLKQSLILGVVIAGHHYGSEVLSKVDASDRLSLSEGETVDGSVVVRQQKIDIMSKEVRHSVRRLTKMEILGDSQRKSIEASKEFVNQTDVVTQCATDVGLTTDQADIVELGANSKNVEDLSGQTTNKLMDAAQTELSKLVPSSSGGSSNSFVSESDTTISIESFTKFLDGLTLLEESAILHILIFILIIFTLFSIIGIFLGNELIKYFDLENKYPSLSKFV